MVRIKCHNFNVFKRGFWFPFLVHSKKLNFANKNSDIKRKLMRLIVSPFS